MLETSLKKAGVDLTNPLGKLLLKSLTEGGFSDSMVHVEINYRVGHFGKADHFSIKCEHGRYDGYIFATLFPSELEPNKDRWILRVWDGIDGAFTFIEYGEIRSKYDLFGQLVESV